MKVCFVTTLPSPAASIGNDMVDAVNLAMDVKCIISI